MTTGQYTSTNNAWYYQSTEVQRTKSYLYQQDVKWQGKFEDCCSQENSFENISITTEETVITRLAEYNVYQAISQDTGNRNERLVQKLNHETPDEARETDAKLCKEFVDIFSLKQQFLQTEYKISYFQQIPLKEWSRNLTNFSSHHRAYRFTLLVFGMKISPNSYQRMMNVCFAGLTPEIPFFYIHLIVI